MPIRRTKCVEDSLFETLKGVLYLYSQYANLPSYKTQILSSLVTRLDLDGIKEQLSESLHVTDAISCSLINGFSQASFDVRYWDRNLFFSDPYVDNFLLLNDGANKLPGEYILVNGREWVFEQGQHHSDWYKATLTVITLTDFNSSTCYKRSLLKGNEFVKDNRVIWCLPNYINFRKFDYEVAGRFLGFLSGRIITDGFLNDRNARSLTCRSDYYVNIHNDCCRFNFAGNLNRETVELIRNCELHLWDDEKILLSQTPADRLILLFKESQEKITVLDDNIELVQSSREYSIKHANEIIPMESEQRAYVFENRYNNKKFTFLIFKNSGWKFFFRLKSNPKKITQPPPCNNRINLCCIERKIESYFNTVNFSSSSSVRKEKKREKEKVDSVIPCFTSSIRMTAICSNKVAEVKTTSRSFSFKGNYNKRFIQSIIRIEKPKCTVTNFLRKHPSTDNIIYNINYNGGILEKTLIIRQLVNFKNSCTSVSPFQFHSFNVSNMNYTAYFHGTLNGDAVHSRFLNSTPIFNRQIRFHGLELKLPNSVFLFQSLSLCIPSMKGIENSISNFIDKAVKENKVIVNMDKNYIFCKNELRNKTLIDKKLHLLIEIIYEVGRLILTPQETANLVHLLSNLSIRIKHADSKTPIQTFGTFYLHAYGKSVSLHRNWFSRSIVRGWNNWYTSRDC